MESTLPATNPETKNSSLFTELSAEESLSINGGRCRTRITNRVRNQVIIGGSGNFVVVYNM
ncbi:MAG: hypothetical protein WCD53_00420 [Microcoleus sp.]